jgi:fermentation-respiration switch protein FrsA (DUF1100 family)
MSVTEAVASKFLFFPTKVHNYHPSQMDGPMEDLFFDSTDGIRLHGWFFTGKRKDRTLLYLHGNAGNIGDRVEKIRFLQKIGWNVLAFDYRGYGMSQGSPSIEGILEDGRAAVRFLTDKIGIPNDQIILFGESLGGAVAVEIAAEEPVAAVILESTFTSLRELAHAVYRFLPEAATPDVYRSQDLIRRSKAPVLVIHGTEDEVVPFPMGKKLFEAAPHPKRFFSVPGAHHNDVFDIAGKDYLGEIETFLAAAELT